MELPVKLTPTMSHVQLARSFALLNKNREIWIYDNNILIKNSPFNSYAEAQEAINISRKSLIIQRYLDTGKLYLNRYIFSSEPLNNK